MKKKTYSVRGNKELGRALYAAQLTRNINRQLHELYYAIINLGDVAGNYEAVVKNMEILRKQVSNDVGDALIDYR